MQKKNFFTALVAGILGAGFTLAIAVVLFVNFGGIKKPQQVYAQENILDANQYSTLTTFQEAFNQIAEAVLPSVVRVDVVTIERRQVQQRGGSMFDFFFNFPNPNSESDDTPPQEREYKRGSLGSGFVIEREGNTIYMLTNHHVVDKATQISVQFFDGASFDAELLGTDPRKDIALIKADVGALHPNIRPVKLADSASVKVGDWVLAVGSPFGFDFSVTSGIISAIGRTGGPSDSINDFMQTDASINQGNSGGPLVNIRGEVVGINDWIATQNGGSIGLGFSIPINNVKVALPALKQGKSPEYGWLGITINDVNRLGGKDYATSAGFTQSQGAIILGLFSGGPAERGGLRPGDLVLSVNGQKVEDGRRLSYLVGSLAAGETATMVVIRDGREQNLTMKVEARPDAQGAEGAATSIWPSLLPMPLNAELRRELRLTSAIEGVVIIGVEQRSLMATAGLRQGDVVTAINGTPVTNIASFYRALNADTARGRFQFDFIRNGQRFNIGVNR
jgi:Do/DeqQ family serine protease